MSFFDQEEVDASPSVASVDNGAGGGVREVWWDLDDWGDDE
jgi:hypothetical protein